MRLRLRTFQLGDSQDTQETWLELWLQLHDLNHLNFEQRGPI